jgi:hypothetical protein
MVKTRSATALPRFRDSVAPERAGKAARGIVVEENQHSLEAWGLVETLSREVEYSLDLVARNGILLHDFINGHASSRFSKMSLTRDQSRFAISLTCFHRSLSLRPAGCAGESLRQPTDAFDQFRWLPHLKVEAD